MPILILDVVIEKYISMTTPDIFPIALSTLLNSFFKVY
jgi:hypothetical protein